MQNYLHVRMKTIYAVLDLDYWYNTETGDEDNIMFALNHKLRCKINKIKDRKRKLFSVTVVGVVDKATADSFSVLLERVLCLLNAISEPKTRVRFKDFVLLDKNRHGKALRPRTGLLLASDSPPSDVSGKVIFLTRRPCIRALLKSRHSWWGNTVGRLKSVSKLRCIR